MKKIIFMIITLILISGCQRVKNVVATVDGAKKNRETAEYNTEKSRRMGEMPDISVFFPEEEKEENKYSSSLWSAQGKSLYGDGRASRVGDIVFILINEEASAKLGYNHSKDGYTDYVPEDALIDENVPKEEEKNKSDGNRRKKKTAEEIKKENIKKRPKPESNDYNAIANSSRGTSFSGKVAARVEAVDKYGNLYLKGVKTTLLNNEIVTLVVTGYARKEDVSIDNSINSSYIENMEFSYNGAMYVGEPKVTNIGDNKKDLKSEQDETKETSVDDKKTKKKRKWFFGLF